MRSSLHLLAVALLLAAPAALQAQQPRTISAGMTMDEVRATFGAPNVVRLADGWTYFFYPNRCLPRCGTDDTVFFREGVVIAAVLHSPARRYSGPAAAPALGAVAEPRGERILPPRTETGGAVTGLRIRQELDDRPVDLGIIRGEERPEEAAEPVAAPGEVAEVPPGPDQPRQEREQRVEPTTVRPEPTPAQPAETRTREERIEVNTIRRP